MSQLSADEGGADDRWGEAVTAAVVTAGGKVLKHRLREQLQAGP